MCVLYNIGIFGRPPEWKIRPPTAPSPESLPHPECSPQQSSGGEGQRGAVTTGATGTLRGVWSFRGVFVEVVSVCVCVSQAKEEREEEDEILVELARKQAELKAVVSPVNWYIQPSYLSFLSLSLSLSHTHTHTHTHHP